ncbi:MAG: DUF3135 domain-containing protein [Nitrosomonas sp.]|jgi:hypothetical protein|nr:DUF3135 domain-containing protein [Nitrosomonas sp.]MBP6355393.1 DUF3135 domain-containing protein [Nitrosomonas sp.]MBP9871164.1 DUF3135 domain-containing protein [Nitrosomonas sp.]HQV88859.1 DUF3135 domain-containing protein [Nitrosomonas sp.]
MTEKEKIPEFDFEEWSKIAQQDPEKFEAMRRQLLNNLIEQSPAHLKQRMIGLQWQVDQIRNQADNPMAACLQISQKMWNHVLGENGLLNTLREPKTILNALNNAQTATVLSFEKYKASKKD